MKSIDRRLGRLEVKLGIATNRPRVVVVMSDLVGRGLDDDTCLQILREGGFPPGRPGEEVPPMEITNVFIAPDGEVTDSFVITIPPNRLQPRASTQHEVARSDRTKLKRHRACQGF